MLRRVLKKLKLTSSTFVKPPRPPPCYPLTTKNPPLEPSHQPQFHHLVSLDPKQDPKAYRYLQLENQFLNSTLSKNKIGQYIGELDQIQTLAETHPRSSSQKIAYLDEKYQVSEDIQYLHYYDPIEQSYYLRDKQAKYFKIYLFESLPKVYTQLQLKQKVGYELGHLQVQNLSFSLESGLFCISFQNEVEEWRYLCLIKFNRFQAQDKKFKLEKLVCIEPKVFNYVVVHDRDKFVVVFTVLNQLLRPDTVYKMVGIDAKKEVVFQDAELFLDVNLTRSKEFVVLTGSKLDSSQVYILDKKCLFQGGSLYRFHKLYKKVEVYLDHVQDKFIVLTNFNNPNFQLFQIPQLQVLNLLKVNQPVPWLELSTKLNLDESMVIVDVELYNSFAVILGKLKAKNQVWLYNFETESLQPIAFVDKFNQGVPMSVRFVGNSKLLDTDHISFQVESPVDPPHTYQIQLKELDWKVQLGNQFYQPINSLELAYLNPIQFETVFIPSLNESLPITLYYSKELDFQPSPPVLMVAYGSYGIGLNPTFRPHHLPLLKRGWVIALVHVRGGNELGSSWYFKGRQHLKLDSVVDFTNATLYLKQRFNMENPNQLIHCEATSAGGVIVTTAVHRHPELYSSLTLHSPFLHLTHALSNPNLPLTQVELEEWGDPNLSYHCTHLNLLSPFTNLDQTQANLPKILIFGGQLDQRISPIDLLKYTAKLRSRNSQVYLEILKNMSHSPPNYHLQTELWAKQLYFWLEME